MKVKLFILAVFCVLFSSSASALTELSAMVRGAYVLRETPSIDSIETPWQVEDEEEVFVLGSSLDSSWIQVLKRNGKSGWLPVHQVDLKRVDQKSYDDFYFALMRERRATTRWNFEMGLGWGTAPIGVGAEMMLRLNLFRDGMLTNKSDQFEIGTGLRYHLGANPSPTIEGDTLVSANAQPFYEVPLELSLLFRLGYRGALLVGPHFGVSFVNDPYARFNPAMPAITGFQFRYYPRDSFGLYWNTWVHLRSEIYYGISFGVNWRF